MPSAQPLAQPATLAPRASAPSAPPLWQAPASWRAIDFISDLHLCEAMPRTFEAFTSHLGHTSADAVFVLGDLFELWVGDDARHEPFAQRCVEAMATASKRVALHIMVGNRDFLIGKALLEDAGAQALADPTVLSAFGQHLVLMHGDELCLADTDYQAFRRQVRHPEWQAKFLARPLSERLAIAREIRRASDTRRQFDGEGSADVDVPAACAVLAQARANVLVHGHTHRPGTETWPGGCARHVLTDWDLDGAGRAEILRLTARGFERLAPARGTVR